MTLEERVQKLPVSELLGMLEDAEGESMHCVDDDCGCHRAPGVIRDEIESRTDPR